jgi:hypothetical protein
MPHKCLVIYPQLRSENLRIPKGFRLKAQGWRAAPTLGRRRHTAQPQRGCGTTKRAVATPLGLKPIPARFPRVARSSQPWALFQNPFGIRRNRPSNLWVMTWPSRPQRVTNPRAL